jgi:hypothetical protein
VRRARVRTAHADPEAAAVVAAALAPDNTASMTTRADGGRVVTTMARDTTGGLHATVDDYVVNLTVADRLAGAGRVADAEADGPAAAAETETADPADGTDDGDDGGTAEAGTTRGASPDGDAQPDDRDDDTTKTTHDNHE